MFALTYDLGVALSEVPAVQLHLYSHALLKNYTTSNVIADTPEGDPGLTVVVGSHLDSGESGWLSA